MGQLTARLLEGIIRYDIGAHPGTPIEWLEMVNMAGQRFVALNAWKWLEGRQLVLRTRPQIAIEGATWTEATLRLTKVGAFASYEFLSADTFQLTDGTGATVGTYEIVAKFSDDALTLRTSIGAAANGQTNIDGTMRNDQVEIDPDFDFQAITAYALTNGLVGSFELTGTQGMLDLRTWPGLSSTISFWAVLNWVRGLPGSGGQPVPRLDLWPAAPDATEQIVLFYRAGWREVTTDTEVLSLPNWLNGLFIEVLRCVVSGFEDPEEGSVAARLTELKASTDYIDAVTRDAMAQPTIGPMANTWLEGERPDWRERFSLYRTQAI